MHSLPRWFGRKKKKKEPTIDIISSQFKSEDQLKPELGSQSRPDSGSGLEHLACLSTVLFDSLLNSYRL